MRAVLKNLEINKAKFNSQAYRVAESMHMDDFTQSTELASLTAPVIGIDECSLLSELSNDIF